MLRVKQICITTIAAGALIVGVTVMNSRQALAQGGQKPLAVVVDDNGFEPVAARVSCNITLPSSGCDANIYTVPEGKRLVVEYFSLLANMSSVGETVRASLGDDMSAAQLYLPLVPAAVPGPASAAITSAGQVVRLYFESGETVQAHALRTAAQGNAGIAFQITGHLVDAPPQ